MLLISVAFYKLSRQQCLLHVYIFYHSNSLLYLQQVTVKLISYSSSNILSVVHCSTTIQSDQWYHYQLQLPMWSFDNRYEETYRYATWLSFLTISPFIINIFYNNLHVLKISTNIKPIYSIFLVACNLIFVIYQNYLLPFWSPVCL